jgi:hypothetical protein
MVARFLLPARSEVRDMPEFAQRRSEGVQETPSARRTAVILNANAKRVTEKVRRDVTEVVPHADVFYTQSLEEAAFVTRRVADNGYDFVFTGGGTARSFMRSIRSAADSTNSGGPIRTSGC